MRIDLNSDLGEGFGPWSMGDDDKILSVVTSANVACGGHAGDPEVMFRTLSLAAQKGVVVGAHPGYPDREGFGRRIIPMAPQEIGRMVATQIGALQAIAAMVPNCTVKYVKPHGALGNLAARDEDVARAIVDAVQAIGGMGVLAISGGALEKVSQSASLPTFSEIFADRGYLSSGQLVPRGQDGDLIHDAEVAADRILNFLETGKMPVVDGEPITLAAHSICVHGDSPGAVSMAQELRSRLVANGVTISSFLEC